MKPLQNAYPQDMSLDGPVLAEPFAEPSIEPVGVSAVWRKLIAQARIAAPHLRVATIEGEPGTGKSLLTRFIHRLSPLARLGFQRHDARQWLASECDLDHLSGFLYLDRVELLEPAGQSLLLSLLKALHERPTALVTLTVSSQIPLRLLAGKGQFIPDLAFRLTSVRFALPPLRTRKEDISPIAQALLERIGLRYQMNAALLGQGALPVLLQYNWPGNVRELASVLEAALLESTNGIIRPGDLSLQSNLHLTSFEPISLATPLQFPPKPGGAAVASQLIEFEPLAALTSLNLDDVIHRHVVYVLELNRGNKLQAARQLGISRSTLYRILGGSSPLGD